MGIDRPAFEFDRGVGLSGDRFARGQVDPGDLGGEKQVDTSLDSRGG